MGVMDRARQTSLAKRAMRGLNAHFGLSGKVKLTLLAPSKIPQTWKGCFGYCRPPSRTGVVRIVIAASRMSETTFLDTLVHEYGHAIMYHLSPHHRAHHGAGWGRAYAAAYNALMGVLGEQAD